MGPAKNNLGLSRIRRPESPKTPKNTKIPLFFFKTAILGIGSRKRVIFDRVTLCFATVSDFFSQKIAARCSSGTFFFFFRFFRNCRVFGGVPMRTAAALHCGVIWGQFFFDQKSTFFNFDFDKKGFGGVGPIGGRKKNCGLFFP